MPTNLNMMSLSDWSQSSMNFFDGPSTRVSAVADDQLRRRDALPVVLHDELHALATLARADPDLRAYIDKCHYLLNLSYRADLVRWLGAPAGSAGVDTASQSR